QLFVFILTMGKPPTRATPWINAFVMSQYERLYKPFTPPPAYVERGTAARLGFYGVLGTEYDLMEKVNVLRGLLDMFSVIYPQVQEIDFRVAVPKLEVPVYVLDGTAELRGRREPMLEWFEALDAPIKRIYAYENAAHSVAFEQFEALGAIMNGTVLFETYLGWAGQ